MVNSFLLMVSALRGVPPVSLQPGKQLCRHSSAADGGLSLGPPSRKPLKSLGRSSTLRPPLSFGTPSNRDIGKHLLCQSGRKIVDARERHGEDVRTSAKSSPIRFPSRRSAHNRTDRRIVTSGP